MFVSSNSFACPHRTQQRYRKRERTVTLNRDIYPNLKLRMYTTGIRQNRLARMLGIHEASLSRIMNGFREPTGDIRVHLAEILQSDPDWLFYKMQISDDVAFTDGHLAVHQ
jgi:transcriptional regulator with XRE-family HTH domain